MSTVIIAQSIIIACLTIQKAHTNPLQRSFCRLYPVECFDRLSLDALEAWGKFFPHTPLFNPPQQTNKYMSN